MIGAGLAGSLLAILLSRRGWRITVYERRGDPRVKGYESGRSINLALAERGRHALRVAGVEEAVMRQAVMMRGRMIHGLDGSLQLQRYGRDDSEAIWSVHRADLNVALLEAAQRAGATIHFHRRLHTVDFDAGTARLIDDRDDQPEDIRFSTLVGSDGAGSALRAEMVRKAGFGERTDFLDHSYKELTIPPGADGGFRIEANALHIWPRGRYMCIALPNDEGTFTVTVFLPNHPVPGTDDPSFASVRSGREVHALFARDFADALPLIPDLERDWERHPPGLLGTLYLDRWHLDGRAVLLGDAAHAMVPFHGQGMNCAFEDCVALAEALDRHVPPSVPPGLARRALERAFAAFEAERKPNAAAIQSMALENYVEMRDRVDDPDFLLQRELERALQERHPQRFVPHYAMVTFMRIPYAVALQRSEVQREILVEATRGRHDLAGIDWEALAATVHARLPMLAQAR
ncbi:kynurenine 3-monooxygenase [Pseudoxanthomonas broegbernensis]|uniref:Kynurenine 3-monooxygenase n=1 Tax=Pseudoxanthomonas broegbernensis TaxID=83619 RepID=A0A7V8K810_9GAMM|nr:kynurenine 3-monooxygenase [Pseudoxanthomonas broegbernensis]